MRSAIPGRPASRLAFVAVAAASTVCTCAIGGAWSSAARGTSPVQFLARVVGQIARNDYGRAWLSLYPGQQQAISRQEYVACEQLSPIPGRLASLTVIRVRPDSVHVAGGPDTPVPSTAVTFRIRISDRSIPATVDVVHTVHALRAGGRWTWMLPAARYQADSSGDCSQRIGGT